MLNLDGVVERCNLQPITGPRALRLMILLAEALRQRELELGDDPYIARDAGLTPRHLGDQRYRVLRTFSYSRHNNLKILRVISGHDSDD